MAPFPCDRAYSAACGNARLEEVGPDELADSNRQSVLLVGASRTPEAVRWESRGDDASYIAATFRRGAATRAAMRPCGATALCA